MATGRHGGYRYNDFRVSEAEFGISRKHIVYSESAYYRIRNGERESEKALARSSRSRIRLKDMKEKEAAISGVNGTTSSLSHSESFIGLGQPVSIKDLEPGELSSDGSDESVHVEGQVYQATELNMLENRNLTAQMDRKRKFSPVFGDREDEELHKLCKNVSETTHLPLHQSSITCYRQSLGVDISSKVNEQIAHSDDRSANVSELSLDHEQIDFPEFPLLEYSLPPNECWSGHHGTTVNDNDDVPSTQAIISSRWASDFYSSADEGEISDQESVRKVNKKYVSEIAGSTRPRKSTIPELGEVTAVASDGSKGMSYGSVERVRFSSRDSCHDLDAFVGVDNEHDHVDISVHPYDTDSEDDSDSHGTTEPAHSPQRSFNMLQGCRNVDEFERMNKIDEGTYGVVFRARDKKTGEIVALKKVKMEKEREGFPLTSLREINVLLSCHHPFIVNVKEVVVGRNLDSIFMVMEYMEHDLKGLIEMMRQPFSQSQVKCLMLQLLGGVKYLHENWVLHRDLKTSNLLLNNCGDLKICDIGLARQYGIPLKPYTPLVVTLWYRAPELLLGAKQYSTAIDMWSVGCIMAELLAKDPLFNGKTEFEQLDKIFNVLGTPNETIWPGFSQLPGVKVNFVKQHYNQLRRKFPATSFTGSPVLSDAGFDLLNKLLTYDPNKRISADEALKHSWFCEVPLPKSKDFMPTFPAQHALDRRMRRVMKSPDPLEVLRRKELQQGELGTGGLFDQ